MDLVGERLLLGPTRLRYDGDSASTDGAQK
jgi:hypothetical protein